MLHYVERNKGNTKNVAVVLHGFGANEEDLLPITEFLGGDYHWVVPRAPITLQEYAYAWFPKDEEQLQAIMQSAGDFPDFSSYEFPDITAAAGMVCELIEHLAPENLVLIGYSQGGMVAIETALKIRPKCICVFSSAIIAEERWKGDLSKLSLLPVFQSHGIHDDVIPYKRAEHLHSFLTQQCNVHFQSFEGGHELPTHILDLARSWLAING